MQNVETMLAFDIWRRFRDDPSLRCVRLWHDAAAAPRVASLRRMLKALPVPIPLALAAPSEPIPPGQAPKAVLHAYLAADPAHLPLAPEGGPPENLARPGAPLSALDTGLLEELGHHDISVGGRNEASGEDAVFAAAVLQQVSQVHCQDSFPAWAMPEIAALRQPGERLVALDIGCGPLTGLRMAQLEGWMEVVGVDPLNDLYAMVLARHGLDAVPEIHPTQRIAGFAESFVWPAASVSLVYTRNAIDHVQDLPAAMRRVRDVLRPGGAVVMIGPAHEGTRQNNSGLHKYDIWAEDGRLLFRSPKDPVAPLLDACPGLRLERVQHADASWLALILRRTSS